MPPARGTPRWAAVALAGAAAGALGFLAAWLALSGRGGGSGPAGTDGGRPRAGAEPPPPRILPRFTDVTEQAGIRWRHEAGISGRFYYPEVMGAGCAFFDYDGDGLLDIYLVNGNKLPPEAPDPRITNVLYRNKGDGTFEDATARAGVGDASYGQGCCTADYDGDGDQDLYVTNFGASFLYRNQGDGTFEKLEGAAADQGWGQSCCFFDADGDGFLDLYVQHYLEYSLADHREWTVTIGGRKALDYCSPSGFRGQQDRLYRNLGNGLFQDVTAESGIVAPDGTGMGLVACDLNGDGRPDIFVSNDSRPNFFFRNDGHGRFTECALAMGLAYNAEGGTEAFMGADAGDYDGDGRIDLVVPTLKTEGFDLFHNRGDGFTEESAATGLEAATRASTGFAPVFIDYDSDGDLDLFFTCGDVRAGRTDVGPDASWEERYAMKSLLLENRDGRFVDVSAWAGGFFSVPHVARACSVGDFDNDGDLDLLVTTMGGPAFLLRNDTGGGRWIGFVLKGKPPNTDAMGARLQLTAGGRTQVREIYGGGSYLGQRDRRVLFGLDQGTRAEKLVVRWPLGAESTYADLPAGKYHVLEEGK